MVAMKIIKFCIASVFLMPIFIATAAVAQEWPNKPIRWIVPFPPGGAMDVMARALADKSSKTLGQAIVIENKSGAGGNIGAELVARSDADGYTMMITSMGMATNKFLYPKLSCSDFSFRY